MGAVLPSRVASPALITSSPWLLGSSLLAWWDGLHDGLISQTGSAVSAHADAVGGYNQAQGIGAARPIYGATSFNGTPGIAYDGVDDTLELLSGLSWLPTGSAGSEDWYLLDVTAPASDAATRFFGAWGNGGSASQRRSGGLGETTAYHTRTNTGNGASTITNTGTIDISGRHVLRFVVEPTQAWVEVDGVAQAASAVTTNTGATVLRTGANANAGAANFGQMILAARIITAPLTAAQATMLRSFLSRRL